jgi:protein-tyrosine phosphatase
VPEHGWRARQHRYSTRLFGPDPANVRLSWIAGERVAIGSVPTGTSIARLAGEGVSHIVNCRATPQTWLSQDLSVERLLFGTAAVVHAPMWDFGQSQSPRRWSAAVHFAVRALDADPAARKLVHCQQGRRRSVLVTYAVLRLRGHTPQEAADLIAGHRLQADLVPVYLADVERWIALGAPELAPLRRRRVGVARRAGH